MPNPFVWYDLMTTDAKAAAAFYHSVVGWEAKDSGLPDRIYMILSMGETMVGGLMPIPEASQGAHPVWMGYIGVDDVDAYTERVKAAGGAIHHQPEDIPNNIGRFAVVSDPQGATFVLFKGMGDTPPTPTGPIMDLGRVGWNELHAADGAAAFAFYSKLFGWTKGDAHDMGPMGIYQIFKTGGPDVGGIMTKAPQMPGPPMWLFYFNVDAADAAVERIKKAGGKIVQEPHQVPGGLWIVQGIDPQGAMFAVVAPNR
jgi:uncharacterized protein